MRINIVSPEFPPAIGGVETYAFEFTRELAKRGHEVTVLTQRHPAGEATLPGVEVHPVLSLRRNLDRRMLSDHPADVWHAMSASYAWLALEGLPTVVTVHGNDFLRPHMPTAKHDLRAHPLLWRLARHEPAWLKPFWRWRTRAMMKRALPRALHIVANSRFTEQALLARHPACRGLTSVGYVGVAEQFFSVEHRPRSNDAARLLTVCRISEPRKNVDAVIRALAMLKDRHAFRYTIVGDGHNRGRLEALVAELGLQQRVIFTGFLSQEALLQAYSEADLFVLTSSLLPGSHEGFGIVYLEAAASGVPSLAARLAGAAEAISEGRSGMFVETPTVDGIAAALQGFLAGELRFEARACREFAREFSWRRIVDHTLPYYAHAIEDPLRPRYGT